MSSPALTICIILALNRDSIGIVLTAIATSLAGNPAPTRPRITSFMQIYFKQARMHFKSGALRWFAHTQCRAIWTAVYI